MDLLPGELVCRISRTAEAVADRARLASVCRRFRGLAVQDADGEWWGDTARIVVKSDDAARSLAAFVAARAIAGWPFESVSFAFETPVPETQRTFDRPTPFGNKRWPVASSLAALSPVGLRELIVTSDFDVRLSSLSRLTGLESLTLLFSTDQPDAVEMAWLRSLECLTHLEIGRPDVFVDVTSWRLPPLKLPASLQTMLLDVQVEEAARFMRKTDWPAGLRTLRVEMQDDGEPLDFEAAFDVVLRHLPALTRLESAVQFTELPHHVVEFRAIGFFDDFAGAGHVTRLELGDLAYTGSGNGHVPGLAAFENVRHLTIADPIHGFSALPASLVHLGMSWCTLRRLPHGVPESLKYLDLSWNPELLSPNNDPRDTIERLAHLTALQTLDVRHTGLEPGTVCELIERMPLLCEIRF